MVDTTHIDLLQLISQDVKLKRAANTQGGEWHGPCPFCGGTDRFVVQPNHADGGHFWCRQCNKKGDAIDYIMWTRNVDFTEACRISHTKPDQTAKKPPEATFKPDNRLSKGVSSALALTDPAWQEAALEFCFQSSLNLWNAIGSPAQQWLLQRGFNDAMPLYYAKIGYNPQDQRQIWGDTEVFLSSGIIIPWLIGDKIAKINIRRMDKRQPKYLQATGGANSLYRGDTIRDDSIVVMVEGEFDALSIQQALAPDTPFVPVATGSNMGARLLQSAIRVGAGQAVLLAFDNDEAGENAAQWWCDTLQQQHMPVARLKPYEHDVNDMLRCGHDLLNWLQKGLDLLNS